MTETTTAAPPAELDLEQLEAWRLKPIADLGITNSVILHAFTGEEVTTVGELIDVYDGWADSFDPLEVGEFNLTQPQVEAVHAAVADSLAGTGLDPAAVLPWLADPAPDEPTAVIEGAAPPPADPTDLAAWDAETARLVAEREGRVGHLETVWEDVHAEASLAKKAFEQERDKLRAFIRERRDQRGKPYPKPEPTLFDGVADDDPADHGTPDPLADLWQRYPIEFDRWGQWGLTAKDCERLNAGETKSHGTHPMLTLGDVTRFITPDPKNPAYARTLKDVKGFGDKGMERWTEAEAKFWSWWQGNGKVGFAFELGIDTDAHPAGPGSGDGGEGGDGDAEAGDAGEPPPVRIRRNEKTGELETVGEEPSKPKRKGKGKAA